MCELLSGFDLLCDESGGIETAYAFSIRNKATFTHLNGEVTALTLGAGKYAYPINFEQETAIFTDTSVGERGTKGYGREQSGTVLLYGNTAEMITNVESIVKDRTCWIVKLNDESFEIYFSEFGAKASDERSTGTAMEDMNGTTLTLTGKEKYRALKISSTIVLSLLEP